MTNVRDISLATFAALSAMLGYVGSVAAEDVPPTIVTLGDSYINGHGIAPDEAFAAMLKSALNADGHHVTIVEVGYTENSRSGLRWLTKSRGGLDLQASPANQVVIVELGQNDCGALDLDHTRANLDQLLGILADKRVPVLVVGTAAYGYCGAAYAEPFSKMFSELATKHGDLLYADFKEDVTGHPELLQADNDHPNAAGEAIVVRNMLPVVKALLAQVQTLSALSLTFPDPAWDGKIVPEGQQCSHYGGNGATPAIAISGIPNNTTTITVAFSDESYQPMNNGGHGTLSFAVVPSGGKARLPSIPGETESLPAGVTIAKQNNTNGTFLQPGYMPPCSGGGGNLYSAKVTALDASKKELATARIELGRY